MCSVTENRFWGCPHIDGQHKAKTGGVRTPWTPVDWRPVRPAILPSPVVRISVAPTARVRSTRRPRAVSLTGRLVRASHRFPLLVTRARLAIVLRSFLCHLFMFLSAALCALLSIVSASLDSQIDVFCRLQTVSVCCRVVCYNRQSMAS